MLKYALLSDKTTMTFKIKLEKYFTKVNFLIFCKNNQTVHTHMNQNGFISNWDLYYLIIYLSIYPTIYLYF